MVLFEATNPGSSPQLPTISCPSPLSWYLGRVSSFLWSLCFQVEALVASPSPFSDLEWDLGIVFTSEPGPNERLWIDHFWLHFFSGLLFFQKGTIINKAKQTKQIPNSWASYFRRPINLISIKEIKFGAYLVWTFILMECPMLCFIIWDVVFWSILERWWVLPL